MSFHFLTDEDFNGSITAALRQHLPELDLVRIQDVGLRGRPDPEILEWAGTHDYMLLSHDESTMPGHAVDRILAELPMPGLFIVPQSLNIKTVLQEIETIVVCSEPHEWDSGTWFIPLRSVQFR